MLYAADCIGSISRIISVSKYDFIANISKKNIISCQFTITIHNRNNDSVCSLIHSNALTVCRGFNYVVVITANLIKLQSIVKGYHTVCIVRACENGCTVLGLNFKCEFAAIQSSAGDFLAHKVDCKFSISRIIFIRKSRCNGSPCISRLLRTFIDDG